MGVVSRPGEMSSEVGGGGGGQALGPLRKRAQSAKRAHKVYVKIANYLKNSTMPVKRAHFKKYRVPLGPSQEIKFMEPAPP